MLTLIKSNGDKKKRQNGSLECVTDLGGWGVRGFLYFGGGGSSMLGFCGEGGLVWLLFMSLNLSHRMYRKGLKNELNFFCLVFFSFERKFGGGKRQLFIFFLWSDRCVAGPLIYVDVSLHSNKKNPENYQSSCLLNVSQGRRLSIMQLPIAGLRGRPFCAAPGAEWHWSISSSSFLCVGPYVS